MTSKRFELYVEDRITIYDNEGVDDYYFLDDKEELLEFLELVNNLNKEKEEWEFKYYKEYGDLKDKMEEISYENKQLKRVLSRK